MRQLMHPLALSALLLSGAQVAAESDTPDAETLIDQHCVACHGSEVYTRSDRRVQSLDALHGQVRMCDQNLGLRWFDDQIEAVATRLNEEYYRFQP